jgi:hypothetical protein
MSLRKHRRTSAMRALTFVLAAFAAVLTGMPLAAADENGQQFASAAGGIRCLLDGRDSALPIAMCQIGTHSYTVAPGVARDQNGGPCPAGSELGRDFRLDQGGSAYVTCTYSALRSGFGTWPQLAVGQTRTLGAITCESQPDGMRCTDSSTGHFFRVSPQSYDVG